MVPFEQQVSTAQWMLERQLYWISQAEVKVAALVTIDVAMLGGLFAAWSTVKTHPLWPALLSSVCIGFLCGAILCAALCLLPRIAPANYVSGLYFGQIADIHDPIDFVAMHKQRSMEEVLDDWLRQVHRNAQIAKAKHAWVRSAMFCSFIGAASWIAGVLILVEI